MTRLAKAILAGIWTLSCTALWVWIGATIFNHSAWWCFGAALLIGVIAIPFIVYTGSDK